MYHRVGRAETSAERRYCVSPTRFREHMHALRDAGYQAISLPAFVAWTRGESTLPERSLLITFDDGFMGVHDDAAPLIESLGWSATMFLVSALIGGTDTWATNEAQPRRRAHPLLGWPEIHAMRRSGWSFGSHSRTHADLPTLADDQLEDQLAGSRAELEGGLEQTIDTLAYPYGRFDSRVAQAAAAAGYTMAFSTRSGFNRPLQDPFAVRRIDVAGTDTAGELLRKVRLGMNDVSMASLARYYASRLLQRLRP
jgi:peptidoglycan/xylan/chitin deacetylase (PgdA/CDA1 family)